MAWHRSSAQGGISTDGVRPILGRTLNHYNTCWLTIEGDARWGFTDPCDAPASAGVPLFVLFLGCAGFRSGLGG